MLQIAVINESTAMADGEVQRLIPAFSTQWNNDLNAVWAPVRLHSPSTPSSTLRPLAHGGWCSSATQKWARSRHTFRS